MLSMFTKQQHELESISCLSYYVFLNPHVQSCMRVFTVLAAAVSTIFYTLGALVNCKLGQSSTNLKYRLMHL